MQPPYQVLNFQFAKIGMANPAGSIIDMSLVELENICDRSPIITMVAVFVFPYCIGA